MARRTAAEAEETRRSILAEARRLFAAQGYAATAMTDVLGLAEWHEVDAGIGMASMRAGLEALHDEGLITAEPDAGLVICLFGALTELGLAVTRDEITLDEAAGAFERLVARLR